MSSGTAEPQRDEAQALDDDGYMLVLRFKERPLIWIAIAILAVFVIIEGVALLAMPSSSSSHFPPPGDFPNPAEMGGNMGQNFSSQGGGNTGRDISQASAVGASQGSASGPSSDEIVTGDEAVTRVKAFVESAELSKTDADELLDVIHNMNTALEALDAGLAKGEVSLDEYMDSVRLEQENARLGILRVLGWQKSTALFEGLGAPAAGK